MNRSDLNYFKNWFMDYTGNFHSNDQNVEELIQMKTHHTLRVSENMVRIGKALVLSENHLFLGETIGIFHDLGRFEQSVHYGTFHDNKSENHAVLSIRILKENDVLSRLTEGEREVIYTAVRCHNLKALPDIGDKEVLFFSRLIRDADKLDVYRVVTQYYEERTGNRNPLIELELEDKPAYSQDIVQDILHDRPSDSQQLHTLNDMKLLQLGWVFDINFLPTLRFICENRYIDRIVSVLPKTDEILAVQHHLHEVIVHLLKI